MKEINEMLTLYFSDNVVSIMHLDEGIGIVYDRGDGENDVLVIPKIIYDDYEQDIWDKNKEVEK